MSIHNQQEAIELLCSAAAKHAEANESGEYRAGNHAYQQIIVALKWLEANQMAHLLIGLLESVNVGQRLWAASYLLVCGHLKAEEVLTALAANGGIHGFVAETTLQEWRAGRLKSFT